MAIFFDTFDARALHRDLNEFTLPAWQPGGWIYLMMTQADYQRVKIGKTINNPIDRLMTLRCADPKLGLLCGFFIPNSVLPINVPAYSYVERELHKRFASSRIRFSEFIKPKNGVSPLELHEPADAPFSEWFGMDCQDSVQYVHDELNDILERRVREATYHFEGCNPELARYTQENLIEMRGFVPAFDEDELLDQLGFFPPKW